MIIKIKLLILRIIKVILKYTNIRTIVKSFSFFQKTYFLISHFFKYIIYTDG